MGTTFTAFNPGQMTQLGTNVNIAVATALPGVAANFNPKSLLRAMEGKGQFLAEKLGPALEQIFKSLFVLGTPGMTTITIGERHDPATFYNTGSSLYVWPDFQSRIVTKAKPVEAGASFNLDHGLLTENMTDAKIEAALPKEHLFDEGAVCAIIAAMIKEQSNGKEGKLLNNGYANLFYTSSYVVNVGWGADIREWSVYAWERDDLEWYAGVQVFSPATAVL